MDGGTILPRTMCLVRQPSAPKRSSSMALRRCLSSPENPGSPTGSQTRARSSATIGPSDLHQFVRSTRQM